MFPMILKREIIGASSRRRTVAATSQDAVDPVADPDPVLKRLDVELSLAQPG